VLAGVGGRTVAEAKQRMSWNEFQVWLKYRASHGPLHTQHHLERGFGLVAYLIASSIPRKPGTRAPRFEDFMPKSKEATDGPIDLATAMRTWR